jgi:hypothetical protein
MEAASSQSVSDPPRRQTVWLETPYAATTTMDVQSNVEYARMVQSYAWSEGYTPISPVLSYSQLPSVPFDSVLVAYECRTTINVNLSTCYTPGKKGAWRDFSIFREAADCVWYCTDLGDASPGMAKSMAETTRPDRISVRKFSDRICDDLLGLIACRQATAVQVHLYERLSEARRQAKRQQEEAEAKLCTSVPPLLPLT